MRRWTAAASKSGVRFLTPRIPLQTKNEFAKQVALVVEVSRGIGRRVASNSHEIAIQVRF